MIPSIALGLAGGAAVFALRRRFPPPAAAPVALGLGAGSAALLLGVAAVFGPTLAELYAEYTESIWRNGHGLFLPLFMFLLARNALRRDPKSEPEASSWGFALLVPALALCVADAALRSLYLSACGLALALPALSLLLLGARRTRMLALPLALGAFLVPIPISFEAPLGLPIATAALMEPVLDALGVPAVRHGASFQLSSGWLGVSRNCSGLSTVYGALALGLLLAWTGRSRLRRLLPLLLAVPLTLLANAARGVVLAALCDRVGIQILDSPIHGLSGIAVYWAVIAAVWLAGDRPALREALS